MLFGLMKSLCGKTKNSSGNVNSTAIALQGSFAAGTSLSDKAIEEMATNWVNIEEDSEIESAIVDEEIEALETGTNAETAAETNKSC